jgi:hypothetical protein
LVEVEGFRRVVYPQPEGDESLWFIELVLEIFVVWFVKCGISDVIRNISK